MLCPAHPAKIGATPDGVHQGSIVDRLVQAIDRAFAHRLHSNRHVAPAGNEDYRDEGRRPSHFRQQLQAIHPRKANVGDDAISVFRARRVEKALGRRMRNDLETCGPELKRERLERGPVVFNDGDSDGVHLLASFDFVHSRLRPGGARRRILPLRESRAKTFFRCSVVVPKSYIASAGNGGVLPGDRISETTSTRSLNSDSTSRGDGRNKLCPNLERAETLDSQPIWFGRRWSPSC